MCLIVLSIILNYILSVIITYNIIFPQILDIFLQFEKKNNFFPIHFEAKLEDFFSTMFLLFINIIICFQLPILAYVLILIK